MQLTSAQVDSAGAEYAGFVSITKQAYFYRQNDLTPQRVLTVFANKRRDMKVNIFDFRSSASIRPAGEMYAAKLLCGRMALRIARHNLNVEWSPPARRVYPVNRYGPAVPIRRSESKPAHSKLASDNKLWRRIAKKVLGLLLHNTILFSKFFDRNVSGNTCANSCSPSAERTDPLPRVLYIRRTRNRTGSGSDCRRNRCYSSAHTCKQPHRHSAFHFPHKNPTFVYRPSLSPGVGC